ncbi:MAG: hypothetical protein IJ867_07525 [Clostridia bacterium]|nr:hypothetical protein [Clostridia bacterium]
MRRRVGTIRDNFPDCLVLIKSGNFYRCYDDDSYIIAYLMDYQVKATVLNDMAGFPLDSLNKVLDKLEMNRVDYKIFEFENGIAKLKQKCDFQEDNCYEGVLERAERYVKVRDRISNVTDILYKNIENARIEDAISKIAQIIYNEL